MGKGDKKSFRGKLFKGSFGKSRPKSSSSSKSAKK
ncbi:MAG: 30S ribosomal protein THX [Sediminibacterium sp.]|nr:30S ribosomal protein THX [Sediminibacterium sp.]